MKPVWSPVCTTVQYTCEILRRFGYCFLVPLGRQRFERCRCRRTWHRSGCPRRKIPEPSVHGNIFPRCQWQRISKFSIAWWKSLVSWRDVIPTIIVAEILVRMQIVVQIAGPVGFFGTNWLGSSIPVLTTSDRSNITITHDVAVEFGRLFGQSFAPVVARWSLALQPSASACKVSQAGAIVFIAARKERVIRNIILNGRQGHSIGPM